MDETQIDDFQDSSPDQEIINEEIQETPQPKVETKEREKVVPYNRFKEVNDELKKLKIQPKQEVDALNFIKLGKKLESYSDEEIDFAVEHAHSKEPEAILKALEHPMVQLAISANREKVEKERSLKPSETQSDSDSPMSLEQALSSASSDAEREQILAEFAGYKIGSGHRSDRTELRSK